MPKPLKGTSSGKRSRTAAADNTPRATDTHPAYQAIATRAYELFVRRGATHGHDVADWLAAERELAQSFRHTNTSGQLGSPVPR